MDNRIAVKHNNTLYPLEAALHKGYVIIRDYEIISPYGDQIKRFTGFYDINGREIYTGDFLIDKDSQKFVVEERCGNVFLIDNRTHEIVRTLFSVSMKRVVNMSCNH